jgi:hypothetical protein
MNDLAEFLYQAYASPLGIILETDDPERLRQKLYAIRKGNPDFAVLSFVISPLNPGDLWILKRNQPDA